MSMLSTHCVYPCPCTCASLHPSAHFAIPDSSPSQRSGEPQRQRDRCAFAEAGALRNAHRQCCEG
eukprot:scaffold139781_cov105-Phaeocystis_antarctica.AAC.1